MPWVRLDDHFDEHPKIAQLDDRALAFWVCGLAYCNRNLTDGFIPKTVGLTLRYFDGTGDRPWELLEAVGLWEPTPVGWRIHDYAEYQMTKVQIAEQRDKRQIAGQAGGLAKAKHQASKRLANATAPAKQMLKQMPSTTSSKIVAQSQSQSQSQDPIPRPNPKEGSGNAPDGATQAPLVVSDDQIPFANPSEYLLRLRRVPGYNLKPSKERILSEWVETSGLPEAVLEDAADDLISKLAYNEKKARWETMNGSYTDLAQTFRNRAKQFAGRTNGNSQGVGVGSIRSKPLVAAEGAVEGTPGYLGRFTRREELDVYLVHHPEHAPEYGLKTADYDQG